MIKKRGGGWQPLVPGEMRRHLRLAFFEAEIAAPSCSRIRPA